MTRLKDWRNKNKKRRQISKCQAVASRSHFEHFLSRVRKKAKAIAAWKKVFFEHKAFTLRLAENFAKEALLVASVLSLSINSGYRERIYASKHEQGNFLPGKESRGVIANCVFAFVFGVPFHAMRINKNKPTTYIMCCVKSRCRPDSGVSMDNRTQKSSADKLPYVAMNEGMKARSSER